MTTTDPTDLDRLDALHAAATPGEWTIESSGNPYIMGVADLGEVETVAESTFTSNKRLIVAMHNAWPAISAELRRLRAEVAEARKELEDRDEAEIDAIREACAREHDDGN